MFQPESYSNIARTRGGDSALLRSLGSVYGAKKTGVGNMLRIFGKVGKIMRSAFLKITLQNEGNQGPIDRK